MPRSCPSPNQGPRRDGLSPHLVVLHFTAMNSCEAALERLTTPEHQVSAHYLIGRDGALFQLVDESMRAWHAGTGSWGGYDDINSRSIGIELDNNGTSPFPAAQMSRLETLLADILTRWNIPPQGVIGHSDMAPERKSDPGRRFDWKRLALQGLAVWPNTTPPTAADPLAFHRTATRFGYPPEHAPQTLLEAFRQRFRPWANGPLSQADMAAISDLAARFPSSFRKYSGGPGAGPRL